MKDLILGIIGYMWSWLGEDTVNRDARRILDTENYKVGYMDSHVPMWQEDVYENRIGL